MRNFIVYISGKYSGKERQEIEDNIQTARIAAKNVWELGMTALCPHLNTCHFEEICNCKYEDYINGDLILLTKCDGIYLLPNWEQSSGAKIEHQYAKDLGLKIFYLFSELEQFNEGLKWNLTKCKTPAQDKISLPALTEIQTSEKEDMTSFPQEQSED